MATSLTDSLAALLAAAPGFGYGQRPALKKPGLPQKPKRKQVNPTNTYGIHTSSLGRRALLGKSMIGYYGS